MPSLDAGLRLQDISYCSGKMQYRSHHHTEPESAFAEYLQDAERLAKAFDAAAALGIAVVNVGPGGKSGNEDDLDRQTDLLAEQAEQAADPEGETAPYAWVGTGWCRLEGDTQEALAAWRNVLGTFPDSPAASACPRRRVTSAEVAGSATTRSAQPSPTIQVPRT